MDKEKIVMKYSQEKVEMFYEKKLIAYLILEKNQNKEIEFVKLFVIPEMRGQGIAGIFMEEVSERFKDEYIVPVCPYAYSWYTKNKEKFEKIHFPENGESCRI